MENKINIAELLKDCPSGMELDCTIWDNVVFDHIDMKSAYPIYIKKMDGEEYLTEEGCFNFDLGAKCVIFPKGKTTWEGFKRPFKDGDILISGLEDCCNPFIFKQTNGFGNAQCYCAINVFEELILNSDNWTPIKGCRLATEEEKQKLFDAIKANGYKWNSETKMLEKLPKFKVGDRIQDVDAYKVKITAVNIEDECYEYESTITKGIGSIMFSEQDDWELVPNKFDITTLKPFESRVLVRGDICSFWKPAIFGFIKDKIFYILGGAAYEQCIPYKNNEHLLGTTNDCDEFYKTWE